MAALVLLFAGCTMKAEVSSRPSQAASAPLVTTSAAQTSVPAGTLQIVGKDDNCVVYEIKTEVHDAIFVNCKTGTVAIRNP